MEESPKNELEVLLSRIEERLDQAKQAAAAAAQAPTTEPTTTPSTAKKGLFSGFSLKSKANKDVVNNNSNKGSTTPSTPAQRQQRQFFAEKTTGGGGARFVDMKDRVANEFVEDLRRVAELVVIGENYITAQEKKRVKALERSKEQWRKDRDSLGGEGEEKGDDSTVPDDEKGGLEEPGQLPQAPTTSPEQQEQQSPEYADLFDFFFERNALEMIVNMLTGLTFDSTTLKTEEEEAEAEPSETTDPNSTISNEEVLLPPISIATQAIQSISILIQNVSRATSLYIILSNDHINTLINLPIDLYESAERRRREDKGEYESSRTVFASPELAELQTHFVTFLKSLAMRMNVETLQFFLKYPTENVVAGDSRPVSSPHLSGPENMTMSPSTADIDPQGASPLNAEDALESGNPQSLCVEFPLYERTLEFCAAHQDSFVRITAMNICLNTLRLTTVSDGIDEEEAEENGAFSSSTSSPAGVLHNAKGLPFRERLAIAMHTCTPSRVERLIAPIFTKLSERWASLEEAIRELDANRGLPPSSPVRNEKVAQAKERVRRERLVRNFKDRAADLQDELLLLEDVFKVGLTVLNEQLIEMMLATFVYPMLLQPLLIFYQRFTSTVDKSRSSFSPHPFGGYAADYSDAESLLRPVCGPAKVSLFTIASVFQTLTNPPLLRLLYTALFHPLSPDSTSVPTVRSTLEVAAVDRHGRETIRVDNLLANAQGPITNERSTYDFGTDPENRRLSKRKVAADLGTRDSSDGQEACVFVLSPALAEVLEFKGDDIAFITRTRPNSYRKAYLQCLDVPNEMLDVRSLAVCTIDAALTAFDSKFAANVLFGTDIRTFADDMPLDERNLDSEYAHLADDRGLGGSAAHESRLSAARKKGGPVGTNLTGEVVSALCGATLFASRSSGSDWKLAYDDFGAHVLLCAAKGNGRALILASKTMENRWRQAATFLSEQPSTLHSPMGGSTRVLPGSPTVNEDDYDDEMCGRLMDMMFFDEGDPALVDGFVELRGTTDRSKEEGHSIAISCVSSFDAMCKSVGSFVMADVEAEAGDSDMEMQQSRETALSFLKADALLSLLKDLAGTGGLALVNVNLAGVALSSDGSFVQTMEWTLSKKLFCPISPTLQNMLLGTSHSQEGLPEPGSVVNLAGYPAIPCVCEAPASLAPLFAADTTGVVAEGVTWQSLYLVFKNDFLIFAQPVPTGDGGDGRVIGACLLERLDVKQDDAQVDSGSPARRLLISHKWFGISPPALFLFDTVPEQQEFGPFLRLKRFTSGLDVWFENDRAANYAYHVLTSQMFAAKSLRGRRIQDFLVPGSSSYHV